MQKIIIETMTKYCPPIPSITECGGANSCFFHGVYQEMKPSQYTVLDNNEYGLSLFKEETEMYTGVSAYNVDMTKKRMPGDIEQSDLVFSAGLIEHFDCLKTATVIASHFQWVKPGGIVLVTFPTPTIKYRATRKVMEYLHVWKFFDERPLLSDEVLKAASAYGELLESRLMDKMPLTQQLMVFRKGGDK